MKLALQRMTQVPLEVWEIEPRKPHHQLERY